MLTHKNIGKICALCVALSMVIAIIFMNGESLGIVEAEDSNDYVHKLFSETEIHTIDIEVDADTWHDMLDNASEKEYITCNLIIDGEQFSNIAIRTKGNSSLQQVQSNGSDRYSFKIEFDHYDNTTTYYGLDKLCLNNIVQDNTYMKDFLAYDLMNQFGVASPLTNYTNVYVNGELFGLYLAVEAIEDAFLQRNYGNDYGTLYKPETTSGNAGGNERSESDTEADSAMGGMQQGGMGMAGGVSDTGTGTAEIVNLAGGGGMGGGMAGGMGGQMGGGMQQGGMMPGGDMTGEMPEMSGEMGTMPEMGEMPERTEMSGGMRGSTSGSSTLSSAFAYDGDDPDSYSYIFDNYVTDIDSSDKTRLISSIQQLNEQENLEEAVDVEQLIRYFIVHNFLLNFDSYTGGIMHNYYLYEEDGAMTMLPWDYNLSFVAFQTSYSTEALANFPIDTPVSSGTVDSRPMLSWIFSNEEYTELYHELFQEFIDDYFVSGYFENKVNEVQTLIADGVENDPSKFCTVEQFETGVDTLLEFVSYRVESIQGQLDGTIGSTTEARETNTYLISTGDLDVTDTGSESVQKGTGNDQSPTRQGGGGQGGGQGGGMMGGMMGGMGGGMSQMDMGGTIEGVTETIGLSDTALAWIGCGTLLTLAFLLAIFYKRRTR